LPRLFLDPLLPWLQRSAPPNISRPSLLIMKALLALACCAAGTGDVHQWAAEQHEFWQQEGLGLAQLSKVVESTGDKHTKRHEHVRRKSNERESVHSSACAARLDRSRSLLTTLKAQALEAFHQHKALLEEVTSSTSVMSTMREDLKTAEQTVQAAFQDCKLDKSGACDAARQYEVELSELSQVQDVASADPRVLSFTRRAHRSRAALLEHMAPLHLSALARRVTVAVHEFQKCSTNETEAAQCDSHKKVLLETWGKATRRLAFLLKTAKKDCNDASCTEAAAALRLATVNPIHEQIAKKSSRLVEEQAKIPALRERLSALNQGISTLSQHIKATNLECEDLHHAEHDLTAVRELVSGMRKAPGLGDHQ